MQSARDVDTGYANVGDANVGRSKVKMDVHSNKFALTRWTLVERTRGSSPEARAALSELCAAYYAPVVAYLRREVNQEDAARELAHEFFAMLLQGNGLTDANREGGRFRSYLLGAIKHFLMNQHRDARRQKRGGGKKHLSLSAETETNPGLDVLDDSSPSSDAAFDREWATVIVQNALDFLQRESECEGKTRQFSILKSWLSAAGAAQSNAAAAVQLGMSETAFKVAVHRLRKRFREVVRKEIAQTLDDSADLNAEMRHLIDALTTR